MQSLPSSSPTSYVQQFLHLVDYISDALGASVPPFVEIERLRSLSPGTLGRTWAESLDQQNLAPFTTGPRRKQLHDGIHVLTGYGTDPLGEAEVQAFLLGAKFRLVHLVLGLGLLRPIVQQLINPQVLSVEQVKARLWQACDRGRQSTFDVEVWHPEWMWELPLTQVQAMYNLCPRINTDVDATDR